MPSSGFDLNIITEKFIQIFRLVAGERSLLGFGFTRRRTFIPTWHRPAIP